jgi:hypothetical protein
VGGFTLVTGPGTLSTGAWRGPTAYVGSDLVGTKISDSKQTPRLLKNGVVWDVTQCGSCNWYFFAACVGC